MNFWSFKSKDIGIDLGTANILVTVNGKGIVVREPSVISIDAKSGGIIATGFEAKEMLGRTPKEIKAIKPLKDGVIADFTATKLLLKNLLERVCKRYNAIRPRVLVGVPSGITEVEERAVEELGLPHINQDLETLNPLEFIQQNNVKKDQTINILCSSGGRASQAAEMFEKAGFTNVAVIIGGLVEAEYEGLPIIRH